MNAANSLPAAVPSANVGDLPDPQKLALPRPAISDHQLQRTKADISIEPPREEVVPESPVAATPAVVFRRPSGAPADGSPKFVQPADSDGESAPLASPPEAVSPARKASIGGLVLAVVVAGLGVGGYFGYQAKFGFQSRIDRALAQRHFFSPAGANAADIFAAERTKNPGSKDLGVAASKISSVLRPFGDEAIRTWYVESEGVDWAQTEKIFAFLEELAPGDAAIRVRHAYASGQLALQGRRYPEALKNFEKALQDDPNFVLALNGSAKVYIQESSPFHDELRAIGLYVRVTEIDPQFTWAYKNLGEFYIVKGNWEAAETYMLAALRTSPARPSILRSMGRISTNLGKPEEAIRYYQQFLMTSKDPEALAAVSAAIVKLQRASQ